MEVDGCGFEFSQPEFWDWLVFVFIHGVLGSCACEEKLEWNLTKQKARMWNVN